MAAVAAVFPVTMDAAGGTMGNGGDERMTLSRLPVRPAEKVQLEDVIGEGAYGKVYRATLINTKQRVAVKVRAEHR